MDTGALFTGGLGNDTFNATNLTLTALDSINGGGGTNTLNSSDVAGDSIDVGVATIANIQTLNLISQPPTPEAACRDRLLDG